MKRARKILAVMAGLCLFLVLNEGLSATQAHASTVYGLCISDKSSLCARSNGDGGYVDQWPQDISGDPNQQWDRTYLGQVTSTGGGCWPFTCGDGLNSTYNNNSVWAFSAASSGQFDCLTMDGAGAAVLQQCNFSDPSDMFVWTSTGVLISVSQSDLSASPNYLDSNANYEPLYTDNKGCMMQCEDTWVMRAGA